MPDEPTLGELVRRLAEIASQLSDITNQLRTDFVRKETYDAHRDATKAALDNVRGDITELKTDRSDDAKWRRTASLTLAVAATGWLVTIVIALIAALR